MPLSLKRCSFPFCAVTGLNHGLPQPKSIPPRTGKAPSKEPSRNLTSYWLCSPGILSHPNGFKAEISWWVEERFSADYPLIPLVVDRCDWRSMHLVLRTIQAIDWARQKDQAARIKALKKTFRGLWCPRLAPKTCTEVCSLPSSVISIDSTSATRPWQVVYRAVCAEGIWTPDHGLLPVKDLLGENHTADLITSVPSGSNSNYTGPILLDSGLLADSSSHKLDRPLPTSILPPHATTSTCLQNGQIAAGYADGSVYAIDEVGQSRCLLKPGGEPTLFIAGLFHLSGKYWG